mgnify:CR=1 FL=1
MPTPKNNRFGKPDPIRKRPLVTDNMSEFVTRGKLTKDEKRRLGSKDSANRRYLRRDGGTGRRVGISGGTDAKRKTIVTRNRKAHKRYSGGVNPQVKSGGERKRLERRGLGTRRSEYSGGRRVSVTPGATPITKGDALKGKQYKSDPQGREKRSPLSTNRGATQRGKEFEVGPRAKVTKGSGGYAGYKHVKPGTNNPIRQVKAPKGSSRVSQQGPPSKEKDFEGRTRQTRRDHTGSTRKGSKTGQGRYSSGTANATGARRTGGGKTPTKGAGQSKKVNFGQKSAGDQKTGYDFKKKVEARKESVRKAWEIRHKLLKERAAKNKAAKNAKNNIKAYKPKVTGTRTGKIVKGAISLIPKLRAVQTAIQFAELAEPQIVKAIKARHKAQDDKQKEYVRAMTSKPSLGKTKITQRKRSSIERLKDSYIQWVRTGKLPGVSKKTKRPVANLPSGYKESEKKAFKQTKKWNKVNRKKL